MALTYGNKNVDSRFSATIEPILFAQNVFQEGLTYTAKYDVSEAGEIFFRKLGKGTAVVGTPGTKFTHTDTADAVFTISRSLSVSRSEEIMEAVAVDVSYAVGAENLETALLVCQEAWNLEIAKVFAGLDVDGNAMTVSTNGAALDKDTIYGIVVDDVAKLNALKAKPNTMLVTPAGYAVLLKSPEFLRSTDLGDIVVQTGQVGRIAGQNVFMYEDLATAVPNADYVIYDMDTLAVNSYVEAYRLKDAIDFVGTYAQVKINFGKAVSNGARALVKVNA